MATTGHLLEEMMATYHPLGTAGKVAGKFHWDDLSSVYMTVGDADTFWHPQFFSTVIFESQRSTKEERSWSLMQPL